MVLEKFAHASRIKLNIVHPTLNDISGEISMRITRWQTKLAALLLLPLSTALSTALSAADPEWQLETEKNDVVIYSRAVEGSPYRAVKAEVRINAPLARVAELMGTGEGCMEWRAMCESSEVIEIVSAEERYVYMVLDLPWPISDRDMVMRTRTEVDSEAGITTVHLQSDSARHPEQDYIRAESQGQYRIKATSPEAVHFTYIMHAELGGNLSPGIINSRLEQSAYEDLDRLRALAEG